MQLQGEGYEFHIGKCIFPIHFREPLLASGYHHAVVRVHISQQCLTLYKQEVDMS